MEDKLPWEFHQDLNKERLTSLGKVISLVYSESMNFFVKEMGDTKWSHGCRRYEWVRKRVKEEIEAGDLQGITVLDDSGRKFVLKVGDVPIKVKRTNPEDPNISILRQSEVEVQQLSLLEFAGIADPCKLRWRLVVEDDFDGEVLRIAFIGIDETRQTKCFWELPRESFIPVMTIVNEDKDEAVDIPPAPFGFKDTAKDVESKEQ